MLFGRHVRCRASGFRVILHVARIAAAATAAIFVGRHDVVLHAVFLLHVARITATAILVRRHGVVLHRVLFHHRTRIARATATT